MPSVSPIEYYRLEKAILLDIQANLSEERFRHTLGVRDKALELAERYAISPWDASVAALLHDNAKNFTKPELLDLCGSDADKYGLSLEQAPILHAFAGAKRASEMYSISEDIVNAIRFHTTGRPGMSDLEKLIYLADYTEEGREAFPELPEARRLSRISLDRAMNYALKSSIAYIEKRGNSLYYLTKEAAEYYAKAKYFLRTKRSICP